MAQHTPGPWTSKATASLGPQYKVYPEADGPDIAIVYDHGNTKANAQLIAAAPDLLAACLQAQNQEGDWRGVIDMAIKNATGDLDKYPF
jgi:hypothetical protein